MEAFPYMAHPISFRTFTHSWSEKGRRMMSLPRTKSLATLVAVTVFFGTNLRWTVADDVAAKKDAAIITALGRHDHSALQESFENGLKATDLVTFNGTGTPLLIAACWVGDADSVKAILTRGADPNQRDGSSTPLRIAVDRGDAAMTELLIAWGANPEGFTPLMGAAMTGDVAALEAEIREGADPNAKTSWEDMTALSFAAPCARCLAVLLANGAKNPFSVIETACMEGKVAEVEGKLEQRTAKERRGLYPSLFMASMNYRQNRVLKLLLKHCDPNQVTIGGNLTPLGFASFYGDAGGARLLLEAGAKKGIGVLPGLFEPIAFTPAQLARNKGFWDIADCIDRFKPRRSN